MAISTGIPLGTITTQEEVYIEGAPYIYYQRYEASELANPDSDGFYWGLSGTVAYPVYELGCVTDVTFGEDVTMNAVRCDKIGDKDVIQKRNHLEVNLTIQTLFPLSALSPLVKGSTVTKNAGTHTEKMGFGTINNNLYYHFYMPKVYDPETGDLLTLTLHRAKIVDAFSLSFTSGESWKLTGLKIWAFADDTKPTAQAFATMIRSDASAL